MKCSFILVNYCTAGNDSSFDTGFLTAGLENILNARNVDCQLRLLSRLATRQRHQKRSEVSSRPDIQQNQARESGRPKKAATRQGNQSSGKAASQQLSQRQSSPGSPKIGQGKG